MPNNNNNKTHTHTHTHTYTQIPPPQEQQNSKYRSTNNYLFIFFKRGEIAIMTENILQFHLDFPIAKDEIRNAI